MVGRWGRCVDFWGGVGQRVGSSSSLPTSDNSHSLPCPIPTNTYRPPIVALSRSSSRQRKSSIVPTRRTLSAAAAAASSAAASASMTAAPSDPCTLSIHSRLWWGGWGSVNQM